MQHGAADRFASGTAEVEGLATLHRVNSDDVALGDEAERKADVFLIRYVTAC